MFNISGYLRLYGVDPVAWVRRYDLLIDDWVCPECGAPVVPDLPIATATLRGIMSRCSCGHEGTPYCVVAAPGTPDLLERREPPRPRRKRRRLRLVR